MKYFIGFFLKLTFNRNIQPQIPIKFIQPDETVNFAYIPFKLNHNFLGNSIYVGYKIYNTYNWNNWNNVNEAMDGSLPTRAYDNVNGIFISKRSASDYNSIKPKEKNLANFIGISPYPFPYKQGLL